MRSRRKRHLPKRTASESRSSDHGAQLVETAILTILNHQCLIATKASRVVYAAQGRRLRTSEHHRCTATYV